MPSPFPGMDPYLESHWLDVQPRLIVEASNQIQRQLGDDLVARIDQRLVVEGPTDYRRGIEPVAQRFIEILDLAAGGKVVTAIEIVSPADKLAGDACERYHRNQDEWR